jgi:hypothetical protein
MLRKVLILGCYGAFGQLISAALAGHGGDVRAVIAGRDREAGSRMAQQLGVEFALCDARDAAALANVVQSVSLVINTAGPFRQGDYAVAEACIRAGCHYLDIADGRAYVTGISALDGAAHARSVMVCSGVSVTPAVTSAMVRALSRGLAGVTEIHGAMSPGNRNPRGRSAIQSILAYVGAPVRVMKSGQWVRSFGWTEGEWVEFPPPVGRRHVYLCDVPDLDLFPEHFGARTVTFKAGLELAAFNYGLSALGLARRLVRRLDLPRLAPVLIKLSLLFYSLGSTRGGLGVWIAGVNERGARETRRMALIAPTNGPQVAVSPAVVLARRILAGDVPRIGACPCTGLIEIEAVAGYLSAYGIELVTDEGGRRLSDAVV